MYWRGCLVCTGVVAWCVLAWLPGVYCVSVCSVVNCQLCSELVFGFLFLFKGGGSHKRIQTGDANVYYFQPQERLGFKGPSFSMQNTAKMTCKHLESEGMHVVGLIYSIVILAYINIYKLLPIL